MYKTKIHRDPDGTLPAFAWPGGYPIFYQCADGGCLCPACANGGNGSVASVEDDAPSDWRIIGQDIHYEGPPIACDHCGIEIPSAYGDPDFATDDS